MLAPPRPRVSAPRPGFPEREHGARSRNATACRVPRHSVRRSEGCARRSALADVSCGERRAGRFRGWLANPRRNRPAARRRAGNGKPSAGWNAARPPPGECSPIPDSPYTACDEERERPSRRRRRGERSYTARFREPIGSERREDEPGPRKFARDRPSRGRKYGLLFVLCLLACPLASSAGPPGQLPSAFVPGPADDLSQDNVTRISSILSSSIGQQQQQQQHSLEHGSTARHRRRHEEHQEEQSREESARRDREPESSRPHPYNEYSWEVNQINPWLSACDLAGPAPADLQGSCGPPEVPKNCPNSCASDGTEEGKAGEFRAVMEMVAGLDNGNGGARTAPEQCLFYLEESHKTDICRDDFGWTSAPSFLTSRENRYWFMSGLRLRHCCEHAVVNALAPGKGGPLENVLNGGQKCVDALDKLLLVDALAARLHCEFEEVLARYDCAQPYSVIFNCTHCKEAYRKWVCSSLVPYFAHGGPQDLDTTNSWAGSRIRPCRSFCQSVEQRCPYLLPGDRAPAYPTQYAGEPTFLCRDPKIPETGEQAARALHSSDEDECCFRACSPETSGSGVCVNCADREARERGRIPDPPTAPHCEINPIQPTGGEEREAYNSSSDSASANASTSQQQQQQQQQQLQLRQQQGTSLCGSGAVGSMTSTVSSSDRSTASILPHLFWLWLLLGRGLPVLWISGIAFRELANLVGLVGRFHRYLLAAGPAAGSAAGPGAGIEAGAGRVDARYGGAKWSFDEWIGGERWCSCWHWWWWRWRTARDATAPSSTATAAVPELPFRDRSRSRNIHGRQVNRCEWRRWSWWWWWLYRWWRSGWRSRRTAADHRDRTRPP